MKRMGNVDPLRASIMLIVGGIIEEIIERGEKLSAIGRELFRADFNRMEPFIVLIECMGFYVAKNLFKRYYVCIH